MPRDRKREGRRLQGGSCTGVTSIVTSGGVCTCPCVYMCAPGTEKQRDLSKRAHCGRVGIRITGAVRICVPLALAFNCSVPTSYVCKQKRVASVNSTTGRSLAMSSRGLLGYVADNKSEHGVQLACAFPCRHGQHQPSPSERFY